MRKALYFLADLNDEDISWFARIGEKRRLARGSMVIEEGKPFESVIFVIDGQLEVLVGHGARAKHLAELGAGEIIGELSLIDRRPPAASVRCLSEVKLLAVDQDAIKRRIDEDVAFSSRFHRAVAVFLADRLRGTVVRFGYGEASPGSDVQAFELENELDDGVLDNLNMAGERMRRLIALLDGQRV